METFPGDSSTTDQLAIPSSPRKGNEGLTLSQSRVRSLPSLHRIPSTLPPRQLAAPAKKKALYLSTRHLRQKGNTRPPNPWITPPTFLPSPSLSLSLPFSLKRSSPYIHTETHTQYPIPNTKTPPLLQKSLSVPSPSCPAIVTRHIRTNASIKKTTAGQICRCIST